MTCAETIVTCIMIAAAIAAAAWTYKDWKRQQLRELQEAREAVRAAEAQAISRRINAEMLRNKTMQELNDELRAIAHQTPIRKATGLFSDEAAQALVQ